MLGTQDPVQGKQRFCCALGLVLPPWSEHHPSLHSWSFSLAHRTQQAPWTATLPSSPQFLPLLIRRYECQVSGTWELCCLGAGGAPGCLGLSLLSRGRLADLRDSRVNNMVLRKALSSVSGDWVVKNLAAKAGDVSSIPGQEDPLEKETVTHSSILAWKNPMDRGAWRATVPGATESRTQLSD